MQPGADSVEAIACCHQAGITVIVDECIMTFPAHLNRNP
jgi:predicted CoA-binding protein